MEVKEQVEKEEEEVLAWLAKNPPTFGQHFPAIRWDSARSQGTVLLSELCGGHT